MSLNKLPMPLVIVMTSLVVLALLFALRPRSSSVVAASGPVYEPDLNSSTTITINGQTLQSLGSERIIPLSWTLARDINSAQVYAISRSKTGISLIMIDGSEKKLSSPEINQLPADLQLRIRYENPN
ncbi:MAG: hypothetical protein KC422_07885 [Trueperaceae bacterium]|nr:hypothetical protein [Trueperaceae bacterium]